MSHRQKVVWRNARATLLCAALLAGSGAWAQIGASVLTGNVVDAATKAPVADVVVTATSPGLQGEQIVVTDSTGHYRIPQLPPGTYTLRFEKESYRPFSRTGIDVSPDRTFRLNVELLPETAGATEIVGRRLAAGGGRRFVHDGRQRQPGLHPRTSRSPGPVVSAARPARSTRWRSPRPRPTSDVYGVVDQRRSLARAAVPDRRPLGEQPRLRRQRHAR